MVHSRLCRQLAVIVLLAGAATLPACDRDESASILLSDAAAQLSNVGPSGQAAASSTAKQDVLRKVLQNLQPLASSNVPSQKAAASILMSQAHAGLAENPAQLAGDLERQALQQVTRLRSALDEYLNAQGQAAAAIFDPVKQLAQLDADEAQRAEALKTAQAARADVESRLADIKKRAAAAAADAKARQNQAGQLRQQAVGAGGVQAESLLKQAREISRAADALEAQAAELDARASGLASELPSGELEIKRLEKQGELIVESKGQINARAKASQAEAARYKAVAAQAAKDIASVATDLDALRLNELAKAYEESIGGYTKAISTARAGLTDSRAAAQLAAATANQSLGDVHWSRTHGLIAYAETMNAIATAKPALPDAATFADRATAARAALEETRKAATEAYQAAKSAYEAAGSGPESKKAIERLNERLAASILATSGGTIDLRPKAEEPPPAQPNSDTAPAAAPTETAHAAGDRSTPEGLIAYLIDHAKRDDVDAMMATMHASDPADEPSLAALRAVAGPTMRLDKALRAKFGKGLAEITGQQGTTAGGLDAAALATMTPEQVSINSTGSKATANFPNSPVASQLIKVDNQWFVDYSATTAAQLEKAGVNPAQARAMVGMMANLGPAFEALAADVESGKIASEQDFMPAMQRRMMEAMGGGGRAPGKGK